MTHSGISSTLSWVFLVAPVLPLRAGEKISVGGLEPNTLKNENGERFTFPLLSMVETNAIGLGATALSKYSCSLGMGISDGLMESIFNNIKYKSLYHSSALFFIFINTE